MSDKKKNGAENVVWDLNDLYSSVDDPKIASDKKHIFDLCESFEKSYRGKVENLSAEELKIALSKYEEIYDLSGRIGSFAYLQWSTNTEDEAYGKLVQEVNEMGSEISQKLVFFSLEWLQLDDEKAQQLIDSPTLSFYKHYLETSRLYKPYKLEEMQEQILSAKSVTGRSAWVRFFDETLGAARFELDGETLTEQEILSKVHDPDRNIRKKAAQVFTDKLQDLSRTLTFVFNTLLADKSTNDKLRSYPDWITSRNLSNEIKDETVETLVTSVTNHYHLVQRFYELKKSLLGLDELYEYDRYAPILESTKSIQWDEAKKMVLDSYTEFDERMGDITKEFFDKNWIDAAIRPGKRGGAYSAGTVPSAHPYVFMNYDGKIRDVQTLAHELGHGVHQYLSRKQGVFQSSTPLTTAETASVFGEMLVFQKLKKQLDDPKEKLALLIGKIDDTIATVFRQISMNRFENAIHNTRRNEGELSAKRFGELWMETQIALYGDSVKLTDNYQHWWSYIPHFLHTPGYVYAYAFGELLVLALYEVYQKQPDGFAEKYMELLEAGGSDWPENLTSKLGVDINSPDFWNNGLKVIEKMIIEAESLAKESK